MNIIHSLAEKQSTYTDIRRDIHKHPELQYQETRTAALVADFLSARGIEVHTGIGQTGLVGVLEGKLAPKGKPKGVGLRADMDALPILEENNFAHKSQHQGKMHACGHDGHTASLLAAADYLACHRDFAGHVYFVFQPAEEGGAGAQAMIKDGIFERFQIDEIYGYHNWPGYAEGEVAISSGPIMASANEFIITITGKGSHAALPHMGVDSLLVATHVIQAMQSIVSRNVSPCESAVVSPTKICAGDATNIIADTCVIEGTIRGFTEATLDLVEQRLQQLCQGVCSGFGAHADVQLIRGYPATVNDAKAAEYARQAAAKVVGVNQVCEFEPVMASEDFSFFLQKKPGCYLMLGNGDGLHREQGHGLGPCTLHNPSYDFNDNLLPIAASIWVELIKDRCK